MTAVLGLALIGAMAPTEKTYAQGAPRLVCTGGPATGAPDSYAFSETATCSDTGKEAASSWTVSGWVTNPSEEAHSKSCPHSHLEAKGTGGVARACIAFPDGGAQLLTQIRATALAGYQNKGTCDPGGNYCSGGATVGGTGSTSFLIDSAQAMTWCLAVVEYTGADDATKGHSGAKWFNEHHYKNQPQQRWAAFTNPGGQSLDLATGATYLLDQVGTWRLHISMSVAWNANMAEVSGQVVRTQNLLLRFVQANADKTCPVAVALTPESRAMVAKPPVQ